MISLSKGSIAVFGKRLVLEWHFSRNLVNSHSKEAGQQREMRPIPNVRISPLRPTPVNCTCRISYLFVFSYSGARDTSTSYPLDSSKASSIGTVWRNTIVGTPLFMATKLSLLASCKSWQSYVRAERSTEYFKRVWRRHSIMRWVGIVSREMACLPLEINLESDINGFQVKDVVTNLCS